MEGVLKDGYNALMRYYLNNFRDGTKQVSVLALFIQEIILHVNSSNLSPGKGFHFSDPHNFINFLLEF